MGNIRRLTLKHRPQDNHLFAAAVTKTCLDKKNVQNNEIRETINIRNNG